MVRKLLRKLIPDPFLEIFKKSKETDEEKRLRNLAHLRESTRYSDIGNPGPLAKDIFSRLKEIPGWFNLDDCGHFYLILSYQSMIGIRGDLFEIGSYHGRSTALMARFLKEKERIVICDAFEHETSEPYRQKPSPEILLSNLIRMNNGLDREKIVIHNCLSSDLSLNANEEFRFVHLDGGHSEAQVYFDLMLSSKHLHSKGIIVVDDYHHESFPEVSQGTDRFLRENSGFDVLADLNRHGALGRKLYLGACAVES
jgi:predicted O-methyltransferase YrrM